MTHSAAPKPVVVNLFVGQQLAKNHLLRNWAKRSGHRLVSHAGLEGIGFAREWNRCARRQEIAILVDYPIEDGVDLTAIEQFAAHLQSEGGAWYYAPRPNEYLDVPQAALAGAARAQPIPLRRAYATAAKQHGRRLIARLPRAV